MSPWSPWGMPGSIVIHPFVTTGLMGWIVAGLVLPILAALGLLAYRALAASRSRRQVQEGFSDELDMLRAVISSVPDLIYVKDAKSRFLLANQSTAAAMGYTSGADLIGKSDFDFFPTEVAAAFFQDEQRIIQSGEPLLGQNEQIPLADGQTRWVLTSKVPLRNGQGTIVGIIGIGRNITAMKQTETELKQAREDLHYRATHDSLTSLLNREAILDMLGREMARASRENLSTSVLLADLDHFKEVNDRYGHPVGDQVLRETARRLMGAVRTYDIVGRYGGEEFLMILGGCSGPEALARANQLRQIIEDTPVHTAAGPIRMTISIGVLPVREWGYPPPDEVLRAVDVALYAAKADGRNCCRLAVPPIG